MGNLMRQIKGVRLQEKKVNLFCIMMRRNFLNQKQEPVEQIGGKKMLEQSKSGTKADEELKKAKAHVKALDLLNKNRVIEASSLKF